MTRYVLTNWQFIDKRRFQFDFATVNPAVNVRSASLPDGASIHYLPCSAEDDRERFAAEMRRVLADGRYDAVHLHTLYWKSTVVEALAREAGVPKIIVHAHNAGVDLVDDTRRRQELERHERVKTSLTPDTATHFCACSHAAAEFLFGDRVPRERVRVMPNAIDLDAFKYSFEARRQLRRELGLADGDFAIAAVGRMVYQKNHSFLVEAFGRLARFLPTARLLLVGDGELRARLQRQASDLALGNRVAFLGWRDDVARLLNAFDVFCLPSRFEGLPLSLIETQANGLPCLASDAVTREAALTPLLKFLPLDVDAWVSALADLHTHLPERRNHVSEMAAAGYDIRRQIKALEALYSE